MVEKPFKTKIIYTKTPHVVSVDRFLFFPVNWPFILKNLWELQLLKDWGLQQADVMFSFWTAISN